ncbi:hypothetical protein BZA05DRAFT_408817 [Tricharina praecox]|uniref:uncharacterized protein n=1 Tax=Tricharina praecox TaxID=43433 RepID=UPI002220A776|nr:uncharacterized protein BZA05DRAFT_408817 [Tricharina praecox]KAI5844881.1 hypothetical protein BZA05DRAFT_408817 [Tricharina praecox]
MTLIFSLFPSAVIDWFVCWLGWLRVHCALWNRRCLCLCPLSRTKREGKGNGVNCDVCEYLLRTLCFRSSCR